MTDRLTPAKGPPSLSISSPLLELCALEKSYTVGGTFKEQKLRALHKISLQLHRGECIALVGESGSGKSTILKILARLEQPTAGRILFKGQDLLLSEPKSASLAYRSQVQMIFQDPFASLNPLHTVRHHLSRPLLRHKKVQSKDDLEQRVLALLNTVGLHPASEFADKRPHQMSGGQRQRIAIARALAVEPSIILADEPISMLDVSIRMGVLNLLHDLKTSMNVAYLYVTHDLASARYIADRTMVMYAGQIVEGGPSESLLDHPLHPYTRLLVNAVPSPGGSLIRPLPAKSGSPQVIDPPPGCAFALRCPEAMALCKTKAPEPVQLRRKDHDDHFVACHLYADGSRGPDEELDSIA